MSINYNIEMSDWPGKTTKNALYCNQLKVYIRCNVLITDNSGEKSKPDDTAQM